MINIITKLRKNSINYSSTGGNGGTSFIFHSFTIGYDHQCLGILSYTPYFWILCSTRRRYLEVTLKLREKDIKKIKSIEVIEEKSNLILKEDRIVLMGESKRNKPLSWKIFMES